MQDKTIRVLLVLGHRLEADGRPSELMKERVAAAFCLWEAADYAHQVQRERDVCYQEVILCGGKLLPDQARSEAEVMEELFSAHTSFGDDLLLPKFILEEESKNTLENLKNAFEILMSKYPGQRFAVDVVTHDSHMERTLKYWKRAKVLEKARTFGTLSSRGVIMSPKKGLLKKVVQGAAILVTSMDPNRFWFNFVRPSHRMLL